VRVRTLVLTTLMLFGLTVAQAWGATGGSGYNDPPPPPPNQPSGPDSGGSTYGTPYPFAGHPTVAGYRARLIRGVAYAPAAAPDPVKRAIWAGNRIQGLPYKWGGGHQTWRDSGYDCSGTVSYALHAAGLLPSALDSGSFMGWGLAGRGQWFTVYTNPGHAYAIIAGLRLDTSGRGGKGPRWRSEARSSSGFQLRHPIGY
jgi:hypothetical protein